jgi:protease-4
MTKRLALAFGISFAIVAAIAAAMAVVGGEAEPGLFGEKVGMIEVRGVISDPAPVLEALEEFRRADGVRAVVLRVESPGGGVGASQEIYRELLRFKKAKPVVASLGGVAASGGYYVSAPCSKIVTNPGTVTGSIGVITTLPDMKELFHKIGVRMQVVKSGELKGFGQPDRPLSQAERAMLERLSQDLYHQFVSDVAQARGLEPEAVRRVADGGVFSGRRAVELGLADQEGNLLDALKLAAELGGIEGRPQVVRPASQEEGWLRRLLAEEAAALWSLLAGRAAGSASPRYLYLPPGASR